MTLGPEFFVSLPFKFPFRNLDTLGMPCPKRFSLDTLMGTTENCGQSTGYTPLTPVVGLGHPFLMYLQGMV